MCKSILYRVLQFQNTTFIQCVKLANTPPSNVFLSTTIALVFRDPRHASCMRQPCVPMFAMSSIIAALCHFVQLARLHFQYNFQFSRTLGSCFIVCSLCHDRRARCDLLVSFSVLRTSQLVLCIRDETIGCSLCRYRRANSLYASTVFFSGLFLLEEEHSLALTPPFPFRLRVLNLPDAFDEF